MRGLWNSAQALFQDAKAANAKATPIPKNPSAQADSGSGAARLAKTVVPSGRNWVWRPRATHETDRLIQLSRTTMGLNWEVRDDVDVILTGRTDDIMDLEDFEAFQRHARAGKDIGGHRVQ